MLSLMFSALYNNFTDAALSNTSLKVNSPSPVRDRCWVFTCLNPKTENSGLSFAAYENGSDGEMTIYLRAKRSGIEMYRLGDLMEKQICHFPSNNLDTNCKSFLDETQS